MNDSFDLWRLLAGLGIFLLGLNILENAIKKLSGKAFKKIIRNYTATRIKAISAGTLVTAILQSSSAVSLIALAFVGAGLMTLESAIGVIMGSNLGTTFTVWLVALFGFKIHIESFALPIIGLGGIGFILFNSPRLLQFSKLLIGFGFIFLGIDYMKTSVEALTQTFDLTQYTGISVYVYLLIGIVFTAITQASSASIAIVLTALNAGIIDFYSAAAIVVGTNLGTTVTVMLAALKAGTTKRRVALSHLGFNIITGIVVMIFLTPLTQFVTHLISIEDHSVLALALFHSIFNIIGISLLIPFVRHYSKLLKKIVPHYERKFSLYTGETSNEVSDAALVALQKESIHLLHRVMRFSLFIMNIEENLVLEQQVGQKPITSVKSQYGHLKSLQAEIATYAARMEQYELEEEEAARLYRILHASRMMLHSAKLMKDIQKDLDEFDTSDNPVLTHAYQLFRKRITRQYMEIEKLLGLSEDENRLNQHLVELLNTLSREDEHFVRNLTRQIQRHEVEGKDVSTLFLVNRLITQATRQLVLAVKEAFLSLHLMEEFDQKPVFRTDSEGD